MEQLTYSNISEKLIEKFPEYKNSSQYYDEENMDSPYTVVGNLSLMVFEDIDKKENIELAARLIILVDEIMNNPNSEDQLVNLMQIEVFEKLVGSRTGAKIARAMLHDKSLHFLEQTLKYYNSKDFLEEYRKK